jgi:hypothetical protein
MSEAKQIVEFDEFAAGLAQFKKDYEGVVYDLTVPEQEKQARSDKFSIGKLISKLDKVHAAVKAPFKEKVDLIDARRKQIKDELLEVQGKIKGQIQAHEEKAANQAEELQTLVTDIVELGLDYPGDNPTQLATRLKTLESIKVDDSYQDRKADATLAQVEAIKSLEDKIAAAEKFEAEQKELADLRKEKEERDRADREAEIIKEATERATKMAEEQAAEEKAEAAAAAQKEIDDANEAKAQAEKEAAEAKETAEREAREELEKEAEEKRMKEEAEQAAELKKKQKKQYRNRIKTEAIESLAHGLAAEEVVPEEQANEIAEAVIDMIDRDVITHASIIY